MRPPRAAKKRIVEPSTTTKEKHKRVRAATSTVSYTPTSATHSQGIQPTVSNQYLSVQEAVPEVLNRDVQRVAEFCFPHFVYRASPTGLLPDNITADTLLAYRQIMHVCAYLAVTASDPKKEVIDDGEEEEGTSRRVKVREVPSKRRVVVTIERKPFKASGRMAALCIRLTEQCSDPDEKGMCDSLEELLKANDAARSKANKGTFKQPFAPKGGKSLATDPSSHLQVTTSVWRHLCSVYGGPRFHASFDATQPGVEGIPIRSTASPYNLLNVFSLENSWRPLSRLDVDPRYWQKSSYVQVNPHTGRGDYYTFPVPSSVWCVRGAANTFTPLHLAHLFVPWKQPNHEVFQKAVAPWKEWHGEGATDEYYARTCVTSSACEPPNDLANLTKRVANRRAELRFEYRDQPREFALAWRQAQLEFNAVASEILSPTGDTSPSLQTASGWGEQFLANNNNSLCINLPQSCANLTYAQDFWARAMVGQSETVTAVKTAHAPFLLVMLGCLTVYRRDIDCCNQFHLGPPGVGKSRAMLNMIDMFIKDTVADITDITDRAFAVPGKYWSDLIIVIQDAKSSLFDVQAPGNGGKPQVSSDRGNILKNIMTSTMFKLFTLKMDPREAERIESELCSLFVIGMNELKAHFSSAHLDRVLCLTWTNAPDRQGATNLDRAARERLQATKDAKQLVRLQWHWIQYCVIQVLQRAAVGILRLHNTSALAKLWSRVCFHMSTLYGNKSLNNQRSYGRLVALATVVNTVETVVLHLASPISPYRHMPHSDDIWLAMEKHLVITTRQAIFAIGLMADQWEDNLRTQVIATMQKVWFPEAKKRLNENKTIGVEVPHAMEVEDITAWEERDLKEHEPAAPEGVWIPEFTRPTHNAKEVDQMKKPQVREYIEQRHAYDGMAQTRKEWMYESCAFGSANLAALPTSSKHTKTDEERQLRHLAKQLLQHMTNPPLLGEVQSILEQLTQEMVSEERRVRSADGSMDTVQKKHQLPALVIEDSRIRMCVGLLDKASVSGALKTCVEKAAQEFYEIGGTEASCTYFYGQADPKAPYAWQTITVTKDNPTYLETGEAPEPIRIQNANYFSKAMRDITLDGLSILDEPGTTRAGKDDDELFSASTPWTVVTSDIDLSAFEERMTEMCITDEVANRGIPMLPSDCEALLRKAPRGRHLYPQCFKERDRERYNEVWESKYAKHPEVFQSAYHDAESKKRRNALYDSSFPDLPMFLRTAVTDAMLAEPTPRGMTWEENVKRFKPYVDSLKAPPRTATYDQDQPGLEEEDGVIDMDIDLEQTMQRELEL